MSTDFVAPFVLSYSYKRSLGPTLSRFLTGLRAGRIEGVRTPSGRVLVPPSEYDPETGEPTDEWVECGPEGQIQSWCWVEEPLPMHEMTEPFGWALIQLDGADTSLTHRVKGPREALRTGARVRPVWAEERVGHLNDIRFFEVV
jgi:uncharacterized protein